MGGFAFLQWFVFDLEKIKKIALQLGGLGFVVFLNNLSRSVLEIASENLMGFGMSLRLFQDGVVPFLNTITVFPLKTILLETSFGYW